MTTQGRAPRGSNARSNQDYFTRRIAELLVLSAECESYGYHDLAHHCDMAAQELTEALNECKRLSSLTPAERHAMWPESEAS